MHWLKNLGQAVGRTLRATLPSIVVAVVSIGLLADRLGVSIQVPTAVAEPVSDAMKLTADAALAGVANGANAAWSGVKEAAASAVKGGESADKAADNKEGKDKDKNEDKDEKEKNKTDLHATTPEQKRPEETPAEESPKPLSQQERVDQALDKIRNPKDNAEALERVAPDPKRKLEQAINEAKSQGKELDLTSNNRFSPEMEAKYGALEKTIRDGILNGTMDESKGLQTLAQGRLAGRLYTAGGEYLDGRVPDNWNPGTPFNRSGTITPGFQLADSQSRMAQFYENTNNLLTDSRATPTLTNGLTRLEVARQYSLYAMDHTTTAQGNWGSCWTCSAEAMGWAWRPDQMSGAMNQMIFDQRFVSPFSTLKNGSPYSISYSLDQLKPSQSNLGFDMNRAGTGEQSYVNMLGQRLVGNISGNSAPWNGGDPGEASGALYTIAGINGTPTQYGVGGVSGLVNGINDGTMRLVQYIPFPGHSASNSGRILPTTDGSYLGFGINDNSWGQSGENMFLANQANLSKFRFPGGGGSMFGGPGGMMGAASGLMTGLLGGMQGQPVSQANAQAAQAATVQQQTSEYNKLDTNSRVSVRSVCVQAVTPGTKSLPHVCRLALSDQSLPALLPKAAVAPSRSASGSLASF